jgi:ribonuclease HI
MSEAATMNIDGAARGNPGPAAYAVVINRNGLPPIEESDTLGTATNNVAEYTALLRGLERAAELGVKRLEVFSDSELLVKQMNGEYRVKHPDLVPLYEAANRLKRSFDGGISIAHVRRNGNTRADALCNEALDGRPHPRGMAMLPSPMPPEHPKHNHEAVANVHEDAIACLSSAAHHWSTNGMNGLPVKAVWDELWSLIEDAGLLKPKKKH